MIDGQIISSTGKEYEVKTADGKIIRCVVKGKLRTMGLRSTNPVAVGDEVTIDYDAGKKLGLITTLKDRRNFIVRKATNLSWQYQILVANVDNVFLMVTLSQPKTHWAFIDRFLVSAEAYGVPVTILINKTDLYTTPDLKDEQVYLKAVYETIGYTVLDLSIKNNEGLDIVEQTANGKNNALVGNSGTGKSSLIKALLPDANVKIGELSQIHQTGKNTTSSTRLYFLDDTTTIIDTPGVKGFGLVNFEKKHLSHYFPEIFSIGRDCAFADCTHTHEPQCAVKQAVEKGQIAPTRYDSYLDMFFDDEKKYR